MTSKTRNLALALAGAGLVFLIGGRLALPTVVEAYLNRTLGAHPTYPSHVDDVDIALLRGAYQLRGVRVEKRGGTAPVPFMDLDVVDISVQWKALLGGSLVAEVELLHPRVNFVGGPSEADQQAGAEADWRQQVMDLAPLRINRFAVVDGEVHYSDFSSKPEVDVVMADLQVEAFNLTNSEELSGTLVATFDATGQVHQGTFEIHSTIDPYADDPTFDLEGTLKGVEVASLNDLLAAYGKFDVEAGKMDAYTEIAAGEGRFVGYVKPLFTDLRVLDLKDDVREDGDGLLRLAWESAVGAAAKVLENKRTDRVAAKIPIEGAFDVPGVDVWGAAVSTLTNAYIEALHRGLDDEVSSHDLARGSARRRRGHSP